MMTSRISQNLPCPYPKHATRDWIYVVRVSIMPFYWHSPWSCCWQRRPLAAPPRWTSWGHGTAPGQRRAAGTHTGKAGRQHRIMSVRGHGTQLACLRPALPPPPHSPTHWLLAPLDSLASLHFFEQKATPRSLYTMALPLSRRMHSAQHSCCTAGCCFCCKTPNPTPLIHQARFIHARQPGMAPLSPVAASWSRRR